jgi:hypothetical protein
LPSPDIPNVAVHQGQRKKTWMRERPHTMPGFLSRPAAVPPDTSTMIEKAGPGGACSPSRTDSRRLRETLRVLRRRKEGRSDETQGHDRSPQ